MKLPISVALVPGADRYVGRHFARRLLERGAKVHPQARPADGDIEAGLPWNRGTSP